MAGSVTYQAVGAVGTADVSSTATFVWPAHQTDDVGVLCIGSSSSTVITISGWANIRTQTVGGARLHIFWKRASSGAESDVTYTTNSSTVLVGKIITLRGAKKTGNPYGPVSSDSNGISPPTSTITFPSVTTLISNCLVLTCAYNSTGHSNVMSGWTNTNVAFTNEQSDTGLGGTACIGTATTPVPAAINIGTTTATQSAEVAWAASTLTFLPEDSVQGNFFLFF